MSSLPDRYLILIHKYFRDELSESEQKEFDLAMADPEFQSEIELQAQVFERLVEVRREKLRTTLRDIKSDFENTSDKPEETNTKPKGRLIRWVVSSAAILLLTFMAYYVFENNKPDYEAIYAEYYNPYDTPETQRGDNQVNDAALDNVMDKYENEKYSEALSLINSINNPSENIQLLKANCHLSLGQWENAESILKSLSLSSDIKIAQHAEWYLALSYIQSDNQNLSIELLNKIKSTPNHLYQQKVIRLLKDYQI